MEGFQVMHMAGVPDTYLPVLFMGLLGTIVVGAAVALNRLIGPVRPTREKGSPYECGEETVGSSRGPVDLQFYLYVLVFLILDIEAVFLIPFAVNYLDLSSAAIIELAVFVGLLLFGWAYAWRRGALEWQES